jgi:NADP-dependent 3-hydroxy acid dehydrogenase YdfG
MDRAQPPWDALAMGKSFDNQVVLITGASSGIGAGLARAFAREGARLVLLARRKEKLNELATELKAGGTELIVVTGDVTCDGDVEAAVAQGIAQFGRLDIAIANAGFAVTGPIGTLKIDDYRRQFETNVLGVLRTVFATRPELIRSRGRLVLLGSILGHVTAPELSPYCMSKFAVRALAGSIHGELAQEGVSVTLISPGFVASEIRHLSQEGTYDPSIPDPAPSWLVVSTESAVNEIMNAVKGRKREKVVTRHGKVIVLIHRHFPWIFHALEAIAGRARKRKQQDIIKLS